ncbi:type II toxin-antitoxin system PemK/MazF family toxin [Pseudarthrobacter sp. NPDC058329]|uniref:type II toxin-antitoxin system PemK/MazF family toxin n=1 Tax=Pseudarthrobacter sp. NPDC058329 TaxID=3346448 RepID=UPI0036D893EA
MAINLRSLANAVKAGLRVLQKAGRKSSAGTAGPTRGVASPARPGSGQYPGDFQRQFPIRYAPQRDGDPDPGEVVWAWVPYEEDYSRGKDRPVLLVGRSGSYLLGLMLTSKDRVPGSGASADYVDIGAGGWDRQGRPSEARLDRILQLRPDSIRREGAVLDRARFEKVAAGLRRRHGWN